MAIRNRPFRARTTPPQRVTPQRGTSRGTNTPARQGRQRNTFLSISRAADQNRRRAPTLANAKGGRRKYYRVNGQWYQNLRTSGGSSRPSPISAARVPSAVRRRYGA